MNVDLLHPPKEWFSKPTELKPGMGTTITDDGRCFGYIALFNARYINGGRGQTKPPKSKSGYAYANAFSTKTADGSVVPTGVIAGDGGHHYGSDFKRTQEAYANTDRLIARVKYGEDAHGVWFSGALWPEADPAAVEKFRSTGVSGHWERPKPGAPLELLAACSVNIPGFAQHRLCASATPGGGLILEPAADSTGALALDANGGTGGTGSGLNHFNKNEPQRVMSPVSVLTAAGGVLKPISGVLAVLNSPTIDGRTIKEIDYEHLPLPIMYCDELGWGHMGAKTVGAINDIVQDGSMVRFSGVIDASLEKAAEVDILAALDVLGISIDGYPEGDVEMVWGDDGWPEVIIFQKMVVIGGTITPLPAFQETRPIIIEAGEEMPPASGEVDNEQETRPQDGEEEEAGLAAAAAVFGVYFSVTDFQDLPLADREREWDGDAAEASVREWAGGEDDMDWGKYRKAFIWYDSEDPEAFGSYKLGIGEVIDGMLRAVPRGIFAAAAALQGSRGGVDIPENDQEAAKDHLSRYYDKMRDEFDDETIVAPWDEEMADTDEEELASEDASRQKFATTTIRPPVVWL